MSWRIPVSRISILCAVALTLCGCSEPIESLNLSEPFALTAISTTVAQPTTTTTVVPTSTSSNQGTMRSADCVDSASAQNAAVIPNIEFISQVDLLPTGCELVSSLMLLRYFHFDVTIDDVIAHTRCQYPSKIGGKVCAPHPSEAFIGSPSDPTSFGCFSPVVKTMLESIVTDSYEVIDTTGTALEELAETYIPQGIPVLVWATGNMEESYRQIGWYLTDSAGNPTDEWYFWPAREHCLLLIGYDAQYYYFNDPMKKAAPTLYERKLVERRNGELDQMSIVVRPKTMIETQENDAAE